MKSDIKLCFEPRDAWVGVYWNRVRVLSDSGALPARYRPVTTLYVCILPFLPVRIRIAGKERLLCE